MQLCLTAAAAADLFLPGACVHDDFIAFFLKAKTPELYAVILIIYYIKKNYI